jgi:hypothetical protein
MKSVRASWKYVLATAVLATAVVACAANGDLDLGSVLEGTDSGSYNAPAPMPTHTDDAGNPIADTPPEPTEDPAPMPTNTDKDGNPLD